MKVKQILATIFISTLVGLGVYFYKPKEAEIKLDFPYTTAVNPSNGLSCEVMVGSMIYGSNRSDKGIQASLFKGTDQIAIELDDKNKFKFISKASLDAGQASSSENWKVLQNNKNFLIASLSKFSDVPFDNYADLFYLNKENGMAVWTKTRAVFLGTSTPETQSFILKCH